MTRISDLSAIYDPSLSNVTIVSDGVNTYKMALQDLQHRIVPVATKLSAGIVRIGNGLSVDDAGLLSVSDYSSYTLPPASRSILGGVLVGNGLTVDANGKIDVDLGLSNATRSTYGLVKIGDGISVDNGVISVTPTESTPNFSNDGITIGSSLSLKVVNDTTPTITTNATEVLDINIHNGKSIKFISGDLASGRGGANIPALIPDTAITLGIETQPWQSVYASTLYGTLNGNATKADTVLYNNTYISTSDIASNNTLVVRNASGNITANRLVGTADKSDQLKIGNNSYASANALPNANTIALRDNSGQLEATKFIGVSESSDTLKLNSSYVETSLASSPNTIAARDQNGDITAVKFNGIATTAQYADLAEKYLSDAQYEIGTVVIFGGNEEITISTTLSDTAVAGVISQFPAYLMNVTSNGQPVALRGKVPVKIIGSAKKGDLLVTSAIPGFAISVGKDKTHGPAVFAKCIEDKPNHDRGTIMAVII